MGKHAKRPEVCLAPADWDPSWGVIIPVYKRKERLFLCLRHLCAAIKKLNASAHIVLMDSSPTQGLLRPLREHFSSQPAQIGVCYVHYPGANQSSLRNEGLKRLLSASIRYILFLDSDIYVGKTTLKLCAGFLDTNPAVIALAPPLVAFTGESHELARLGFGRTTHGNEARLIMPSELDFRFFEPREDGFMESFMLRGAFVLRRKPLQKFFNDTPWHPSFVVWQNVDFFLSLREMNKGFGYLLASEAICLHDERNHADTISSWLPDWHAQTLKSLILLFHRNQLWRTAQQDLNCRFLETVRGIVRQHTVAPIEEALGSMLEIARSLSLSEDKRHAYRELSSVSSRTRSNEIRRAVKLLTDDDWDDIRSIRSLDLAKPM